MAYDSELSVVLRRGMPNVLRKLAAAAILAVGVGILAFVMHDTENAGNKDFISYWAAGQLLIHHANPYDSAAVLRVEKAAGFHAEKPLIMRNPPYALVLTLPLGLVGAKTGAVIWSLLLVASIGLSVRLIWAIYGYPPDRLHLFGYMFAPTLSCLRLGQTTAFILLGLVLFLWWYKRRPLLAGACLAMLAFKPHLFLPFGLVMLVWIVASRSYRVLLGAIMALAAMLALPFWLDHGLWSHYLPVLKDAGADSQFLPTVSALVRLVVPPHEAWVQFVPAVLGCIWALRFFHRYAKEWDWNQHGPALLVLSVLVAPYSWLADEIIVMPALLQAVFGCVVGNRSFMGFVFLNGVALAAMLFFAVPEHSGFYFWTPVAWAAWYAWIVSRSGVRPWARTTIAAQI